MLVPQAQKKMTKTSVPLKEGRQQGVALQFYTFENRCFPFYSFHNVHFPFYSVFHCAHAIFHFTAKKNPILHFTVIFGFILHFTVHFWLFFHFTASEMCCFHFTGLRIFPVLQPKFEHFTLYIFKKALFTALRFTYCPPSIQLYMYMHIMVRKHGKDDHDEKGTILLKPLRVLTSQINLTTEVLLMHPKLIQLSALFSFSFNRFQCSFHDDLLC